MSCNQVQLIRPWVSTNTELQSNEALKLEMGWYRTWHWNRNEDSVDPI
jgi:hypothetical protein